MKAEYLTPREAREMAHKICNEFEITLDDIFNSPRNGKRDTRDICEVVAILSYILHNKHSQSTTNIAKLINRNRCSVHHHLNRMVDSMQVDNGYKKFIDRIIIKTNN